MKLTLRRYTWLLVLQMALLSVDLFFNAFGSWLSRDKLEMAIFFFVWVNPTQKHKLYFYIIYILLQLPFQLNSQDSRRLHHTGVSIVYFGFAFHLRLSGGRHPHHPTQLQAISIQHNCLFPALRLAALVGCLSISIVCHGSGSILAAGSIRLNSISTIE